MQQGALARNVLICKNQGKRNSDGRPQIVCKSGSLVAASQIAMSFRWIVIFVFTSLYLELASSIPVYRRNTLEAARDQDPCDAQGITLSGLCSAIERPNL